MIRIITVLIIYLVSQLIGAQTNQTAIKNEEISLSKGVKLTVVVPNVSGTEGSVIFALYDSQEKFMNRETLDAKASMIQNGIATVTFENIEPGTYAIVCLHDKNGNQRMDFNSEGMPAEDYGLSNNAILMGPPNFEDAKFTVENKSLDLTIKF